MNLNLFIKKIGLFFFIFVFFCSLIIFTNRYITLNSTPKFNKSKHILFLGDSNTQCAINDSIISSAINLSSSSESYFQSYLKLKEVLRVNYQIDTIILSFSPINIFKEYKTINFEMLRGCFPIYYSWMNSTDFYMLLKSNPYATISLIPTLIRPAFKNNINKLRNREIQLNIGGYLQLERNILPMVLRKLKTGKPMPFFTLPRQPVISKFELFYLKKIQHFCAQKDKKLFFINTPKRIELIRHSNYHKVKFMQIYAKDFKAIKYIDCSNFPMKNSDYGDLVHLNKNGSNFFSSYIQSKGLKYLCTYFQAK